MCNNCDIINTDLDSLVGKRFSYFSNSHPKDLGNDILSCMKETYEESIKAQLAYGARTLGKSNDGHYTFHFRNGCMYTYRVHVPTVIEYEGYIFIEAFDNNDKEKQYGRYYLLYKHQ